MNYFILAGLVFFLCAAFPTKGTSVLVGTVTQFSQQMATVQPGDPFPSIYHRIHHNQLGYRAMPGSNDDESIRVGDSGRQRPSIWKGVRAMRNQMWALLSAPWFRHSD